MNRAVPCLMALMTFMTGACATPELIVRHSAPDLGVVDIVVDGTPGGPLEPGGSMTIAVGPGVRRVVVRRQDGAVMALDVWVEAQAAVDIVPEVGVISGDGS